ncbi:MAG: cytochrome ubiquinol oxidase subunit I [Holophagaceae bacterium]|nr:cytochrome ubiquinol oxidase subunit I [Holophagaceae bacterium]
MDYPIWNLSMGGGVLIAIIAITHVWVSHFAIGGGLAIAIVETLGVRRHDPALRNLAKRASLMLILVSTVFGAISGVGIWVTIGLVQPAATSALIHNYVWGWAAEWGFFILEVATALLYYATWDKVRPRTHLLIIWLYFFAAYMSLVIIQGIISFMLTPGHWIETRSFWDGIFNPTYFPGLLMRTGICLLLAGAYMTFAALREPDGDARRRMVGLLAGFQVIGGFVAYGGYRWWEHSLPESVRAIFLGASPIVPALATTRLVVLWSLAAFLLFALFAYLVPRANKWPVAVVALLAAFTFFGASERVREGVRKPFVIRDFMFSNGILVSEIADLNQGGILKKAKWAARESDGTPVSMGRAVYRAECQACHTIDGYSSLRKLVAPTDADTLGIVLSTMRSEGDEYTSGKYIELGHFSTQKLDYPQMPPLVGTPQEIEALRAYLLSLQKPQTVEVPHAK